MKQIKKQIRCAIYTRKSTEEGLEQDFNSLDAQHEAGAAYIKSQQHEGWTLVDKRYDDGGFSGGTMERPAFKELMKDIANNEIDIVVVYKIDRLTRSLMDFAKINEVFDEHEANFVSVTQSFNTTTSMGRLTLNMLLSFAQFEREVTGERIRDKIAASKKKGMWMGGAVPIGYQKQDKKLIVHNEGSEKVNLIFDKYLELGSVPKLKEYLDKEEIKTRSDKQFAKGQLYHMLSNKTYIGKITHKDKIYDGEHEAIIETGIFENVQKLLIENRVDKNCNAKSSSNSVLASKIFDDKGNRMSPSHSNTRGRKYRYYISLPISKLNKSQAGSVSKIPAREIEKFVSNNIKEYLQNKEQVQRHIKNLDVVDQNNIFDRLSKLDYTNPRLIRGVLDKVIISKEWIEVTLCKNQIQKMLENFAYCDEIPAEIKSESPNPVTIKKDIRIATTSRIGCNVLIISNDTEQAPAPNDSLIKAIVRSHFWHKQLEDNTAKNIRDIQRQEGLNDSKYIRQVLKLRFLPPEVTESILNGTQERDLSVSKLLKMCAA
jgi:DNA invertase Pin-like site-specific DNA recombinase